MLLTFRKQTFRHSFKIKFFCKRQKAVVLLSWSGKVSLDRRRFRGNAEETCYFKGNLIAETNGNGLKKQVAKYDSHSGCLIRQVRREKKIKVQR